MFWSLMGVKGLIKLQWGFDKPHHWFSQFHKGPGRQEWVGAAWRRTGGKSHERPGLQSTTEEVFFPGKLRVVECRAGMTATVIEVSI